MDRVEPLARKVLRWRARQCVQRRDEPWAAHVITGILQGRLKAMPKRIQLSRRAGWRKSEGAVVVARPTKWGNPFPHLTPRDSGQGRGGLRESSAQRFSIRGAWRTRLSSGS